MCCESGDTEPLCDSLRILAELFGESLQNILKCEVVRVGIRNHSVYSQCCVYVPSEVDRKDLEIVRSSSYEAVDSLISEKLQ